MRKLFVGRYFDIPLYLHWSIIVMVGIGYFIGGVSGILFMTCLYSFVVLHEYGHCLMARHLEWAVDSVTLTGLGGIALIEQPDVNKPVEEFLVTAAGPLVNLGFFVVATVGLFFLPIWHSLFLIIFVCNLSLLLFNILPVFPMDGGRMLRATLQMVLDDHYRATWWAVRVGQITGLALAVAGLYFGFYVAAVIFVIMFMAAEADLGRTEK